MNAEKFAAERRMSNENMEVAANGSDQRLIMVDEDFGHEAAENQLAAISTTHYQERADLDVEALNDWEREHLGAGAAADSDSEDQ